MITLPASWDGQPFFYTAIAVLGFLLLSVLLNLAFVLSHRPRAARNSIWLFVLGVLAMVVVGLSAALALSSNSYDRQRALIKEAQDSYGVVLDSGQASTLLDGNSIVLKNGDQIGLKFSNDTHAKLIRIEPKNF